MVHYEQPLIDYHTADMYLQCTPSQGSSPSSTMYNSATAATVSQSQYEPPQYHITTIDSTSSGSTAHYYDTAYRQQYWQQYGGKDDSVTMAAYHNWAAYPPQHDSTADIYKQHSQAVDFYNSQAVAAHSGGQYVNQAVVPCSMMSAAGQHGQMSQQAYDDEMVKAERQQHPYGGWINQTTINPANCKCEILILFISCMF